MVMRVSGLDLIKKVNKVVELSTVSNKKDLTNL